LEELVDDSVEYSLVALGFRESLANLYPKLYFELTKVLKVKNPREENYEKTKQRLREEGLSEQDLKNRWVFHTNPSLSVTKLIATSNLRPSNCSICKSGIDKYCSDPGFYGDHTKGVYVSKHVDYTFYYQKGHKALVEESDTGAVLMMKMFTGKRKHLDRRADKAPPSIGYHCHETPNHLEFYVWDTNQLVPCYILHWKAIKNKRLILEEGANEPSNFAA